MGNATNPTHHLPKLSSDTLSLQLAPYFIELDAFLASQINRMEPELSSIATYCFANSGKRIRASLVFLSSWGTPNHSENRNNLVQIAAIIEMVHMATLVHDDILDKALIRRSKPTISQQFGINQAVLFGDALFSHALRLASDFPTTTVCKYISDATRRVCAGEIAQTFLKKTAFITEQEYYRIIDLKTAELFRVSCLLGARYSYNDPDFTEAAADFGRQLGIAYQIYDDWLDFFSTEEQTGKTLGTDLEECRFTLPMLLLIDSLLESQKHSLLSQIQTKTISLLDVRALMQEHNIEKQTLTILNDHFTQATNLLKPFHEKPAVTQLLLVQNTLQAKIPS